MNKLLVILGIAALIIGVLTEVFGQDILVRTIGWFTILIGIGVFIYGVKFATKSKKEETK